MAELEREFFDRDTLLVARELLGKRLVRYEDGTRHECLISETEAYGGFEDVASHAHRGKTPRNTVMFGPAGVWYVYFVYGMHEMLNVTTGAEGYPAAVLLRGGVTNDGRRIDGPARLTKYLAIDRRYNRLPAARSSGLWIEDSGAIVPDSAVLRTPRIGVAYAGREWSEKPYRFVLSTDYTI